VEINLTDQRPVLPAACVPASYRSGAWAPPKLGAAMRPRPAGDHRINVSIDHPIAGTGVAVVNAQFTGAVGGVPPRGRPV
jgi:hypothetical protein